MILDAQPPIDDGMLGTVAERCAGPVPDPLVALWRTTFGGRLDYGLRADLDGQDVPVSFTGLFYPNSNDYHDLWGWIEHEANLAEEHQPVWSGQLIHLPIGGFEYLDRVYVHTAVGQDHGAVVCILPGPTAPTDLGCPSNQVRPNLRQDQLDSIPILRVSSWMDARLTK